jgi:hypothetical protein
MTKITEYLESIKSKNSGPFEICITLFFENEEYYEEIVSNGIINPETISEIYSIEEDDILGIYELDNINVIKFSMKRPVPQASFQDADLDGSQQHVPFKQLEMPD